MLVGIIPAAGKGTRLGEKVKALTNIGFNYLIEYPLTSMVCAQVDKIIIIHHGDEIPNAIGNNYCGIPVDYVEQKKRSGIAKAIELTKPLIKNDDEFLIILGDIIYDGQIRDLVYNFRLSDVDCLVGAQRVRNKNLLRKSYGVNKKGIFVEKPKYVKNLRPVLGLGIYIANKWIYSAIKNTSRNKRTKEVEITDVLNNMFTETFELNGFYININTPEDIDKYSRYLQNYARKKR